MKMYEYFEDDHFIYIAAELCPGKEFFDYIVSNKYLKENKARSIFYDLVCAVRYMHDNGFMHRYFSSNAGIWNLKMYYTIPTRTPSKLSILAVPSNFRTAIFASEKEWELLTTSLRRCWPEIITKNAMYGPWESSFTSCFAESRPSKERTTPWFSIGCGTVHYNSRKMYGIM